MNPFEIFIKESILFHHKNGSATGPFKAIFSKDKFTVFDLSLDTSEGDTLDRTLPTGKHERYDVIHVAFQQGLEEIPASIDIKVRKQGSLVSLPHSKIMNVSISNSQGFQIGDHNTQNIVNALKSIIDKIENSDSTPESKIEVKTRLRAFLEHPITSAVIGGASGGLVELLK